MIDQLFKDIITVVPDRTLDVRIHEALTGEINLCKSWIRESSEAQGKILREHGGELKWFTVPAYSFNFEAVSKFILEGFNVQIRSSGTAEKAAAIALGQPEYAKRWVVSLWDMSCGHVVAMFAHEYAAMSLVAVLLMFKMKSDLWFLGCNGCGKTVCVPRKVVENIPNPGALCTTCLSNHIEIVPANTPVN